MFQSKSLKDFQSNLEGNIILSIPHNCIISKDLGFYGRFWSKIQVGRKGHLFLLWKDGIPVPPKK